MNKDLSIRMIVLILFVSGLTIMLTSCSDDNASVPDIVSEETPEKEMDINSSLLSVKTSLESVDFKELLPLIQALDNDVLEFRLNDTAVTRSSELTQTLGEQLKSFFTQDSGTETYTKSWQFGKLGDVLKMAVNLSVEMETTADNRHIFDRNYTNVLDIKINDELAYRITDEVEKTTESATWSIGNRINRKQMVEKNEQVVLIFETLQKYDASLTGLTLGINSSVTGSLTYKDKKFSLGYARHNSDSYSTKLEYADNGSVKVSIELSGNNNLNLENLIKNQVVYKGGMKVYILDGVFGIESSIDNMNKFYTTVLNLASITAKGSSEKYCQNLADSFNDVVKSKLMTFSGTNEIGDVILEPVVQDAENDLYRLDIMVVDQSDNKVSLTKIMELFGLSFESIMNTLLGNGE